MAIVDRFDVDVADIDHPEITATAVDRDALESGLAKVGLSLDSYRISRPDDRLAVDVKASTKLDPEEWLKGHSVDELNRAVFGDINLYDGSLLEVSDSEGKPIFLGAYASRLAHGSLWSPYPLNNPYGSSLLPDP